jgi:hypothetical protein
LMLDNHCRINSMFLLALWSEQLGFAASLA